MPWLYYESNNGEIINKDGNVPTSYTRDSHLDLRVAKYTVEGRFVGLVPLNMSALMLCGQSQDKTQFIFQVGRDNKCSVSTC